MRPSVILNLSSVLFKSYFRASRRGRASLTYYQPRIMLIVDITAIVISLALLQYILLQIPRELAALLGAVVWQALVGLPIMLTSYIIIAGIMFELGQSAGISSSEAVNWLPISPREYVAASAISMITVYSPLFALSVGATLPLALEFGLMNIWSVAVVLSALALLLGAFMVEVLRAVMSQVSLTVYRRSGRFGIASRLVLLIALFVIIQLAFNPYILYRLLGVIVSGVEIVWFIPMIWPSVAIISLVKLETVHAIVFSALSVAFALFIFEVASNLRLKYWSPTPVSIMLKPSTEYIPQTPVLSGFAFSPLEVAIALKDLRALVRRKDMARFLAIPVILIISFIAPTLFTPAGYSGRSPGFFLVAFIPFMIPLMLSMISVGQEGKAVINICMLPISARELIKGKLIPSWIISIIATVGVVGGFQIIAPMDTQTVMATILAGLLVVLVEGFIGLSIGSRYPDYAAGPNSRYVTLKGFLIGFLAGGAAALVIFAPTALHLISSGGIQGSAPIPPVGLAITLPATIIIGSVLSYFAYRYCRRGVEALTSNLEM